MVYARNRGSRQENKNNEGHAFSESGEDFFKNGQKKYLHLNKTLVIINGLLLKQEKSPHRLAVRTRPFQG